MRDKPLHRNIRSAPLYLFDRVYTVKVKSF